MYKSLEQKLALEVLTERVLCNYCTLTGKHKHCTSCKPFKDTRDTIHKSRQKVQYDYVEQLDRKRK